MVLDSTETTRCNMREKLIWAKHSLERMQASQKDDPSSVQENFWSFLHAVHLFWFYFARWAHRECPSDKAQRLVEELKRNFLTSDEAIAWNRLCDLRNEDAHVRPVITEKPSGGHLLHSPSGHLLVSKSGHLCHSKNKPYRIIQGTLEHDLFPLCSLGLDAYAKLVEKFDK